MNDRFPIHPTGLRPAPRTSEPEEAADRLGEILRLATEERADLPPLREWLALAEAWRIEAALRECRGNRSAAARRLGIGRRTLYSKLERLSRVSEGA